MKYLKILLVWISASFCMSCSNENDIGNDYYSCWMGDYNRDGKINQDELDPLCKGESGKDGQDGQDGRDGKEGTQGPQGSQGNPGYEGEEGPQGQPGKDGKSCSVYENDNGTYTICCDDGTEVTLSDGEQGIQGDPGEPGNDGEQGVDGEPGKDGISCTVLDNFDGTYTIGCTNGISVTFSDGEQGEPGKDGESCTIINNDNGSYTIECTDGTSATVRDGKNGDNGLIDPSGDIDDDGIINSDDNCLYVYNPIQLDTDFDNFGDECDDDDDNDTIVDSIDCKQYDPSNSGCQNWKIDFNGAVHSTAAVARDGTIYVGSYDHNLYAISPQGTILWIYETDRAISSTPTLDKDGVTLHNLRHS